MTVTVTVTVGTGARVLVNTVPVEKTVSQPSKDDVMGPLGNPALELTDKLGIARLELTDALGNTALGLALLPV